MLLGGSRAALQPPSALLPPWGLLPSPAWPPLAAILVPPWMSSPAPRSLPFGATPVRSPTRSWRRGLQVLPLPAEAGTTCMWVLVPRKEEDWQPPGLFTAMQEATRPVALAGHPRSWQKQCQASNWGTRLSPRELGGSQWQFNYFRRK